MTELKTDFNVSPYYDDYNENDNFHRILYRPATALQARELTQMQTILQDQIGRAGRFVHAEGALVEGGYAIYSGVDFSATGEGLKKRLEFVRVDDTFLKLGNTTSVAVNNNLEIFYSSNHSVNSALYTSDGANIASFNADKDRDGSFLVGATSGVIKKVFYYQNGLESQYPNTNVLFTLSQVDGINDGNTVTYKTFQKDETLYAFTDRANAESFRAQVVAGNTAADVANNAFASIKVYNDASNPSRAAVGGSLGVATTDGVIFSRGHFVRVDPQRVVVIPFDDVTTPVKYVGFRVDESIITPELDDSLYDNAAGSSNENAPGAHRLKLNGVLFASEQPPANNFASLLTTSNTGEVQTTRELPALNEDGLGAVVAASLKDSAGDYVIGQPKLIFNSVSGNTTHANVQINPAPGGTTYFVNGKRTHHIGSSYVSVRRGTDTIEEENVRTTINYGRYLKVNEFAGDIKFDKYPKVYFVNTDVTAITSGTYAFTDASALNGSIIGNTTLLSVAHDTGTKGTPEATFKLYVDDIKLATGNKITDIAGIMICDGADPDPNNAVGFASLANTTVFELDTAGLVFDTGLPALKQFSIDSAPGTDTEYTALHRRSAVAMDVNGIVSFNIVNATGSTDQPNEQGNPVGDTNEINYTLVPTANIVTSNSSINCAVSTSANTITIASGTPSDYLVVGDCLEVFDTSSSEYFRIEAIDGTTLTVNATPGFTNATANFCRFIPHGVPISLAGSSSNVVANSSTVIINTRFANLGGAVSVQTPAATDVIYNKLRTEITSPLGKDINKSKYVIIDCSNNVSGTTGPWDLGLSDVHRIRNVYVGGTLAANVSDLSSSMTDRTSKFSLDTGQRDTKYDHGRLKIAIGSNFTLDSGDKIVVELDHFTANSSAGEGFYNIESYPISSSDPSSANSTTILTAEIPVFRSPTTGKYYDLRNCIDFRPRVEDTAASSSTLSGATTNPAASDVIELPSGTSSSYISAPSEPFDADVTYYVGRQDAISFDGLNFIVSEGTPTKYEKSPEPNVPSGSMPLSYVSVPPYPSLTNDETILPAIPNTSRRESYFKHRVVTNRRYTMKDVGVLAQRISKLEYYVSLNMLEKSANELSISDDAGLNRFKNGIFVDPFTGHEHADTTGFNGIHKVAIDQRLYHMRPTFTQSNIELDYVDAESDCKQWQGVITLPLDTTQGTNGHVTFAEVSVASKSRNVCDTIGEALGELYLCPNFDGGSELEGDKGVVNIDLDLAQVLQPLTELPFYGAWMNQGAASSSTTSRTRTQGGNRVTTTTTVTTQAQVRTAYNLSMDVTETHSEINNIIQDVSFNQYIRPQYVSFMAFGLLPNAKLHFFFDDELVDEFIQPGEMNGDIYPSVVANPNRIGPAEGIDPSQRDSVEATGEIGQTMFADDNGCAYGIFHIPAQRFFQGERRLVIKEFPDINSTSRFRASGRFLSYGLGYKATDFSMTAIIPEFTVNTSTETQIIQGTVVSRTSVPIPPPPAPPSDGGDGGDPLAMTFIVPTAQLAKPIDPGLFMTEVDIYFRSKSPTKGLRVTLYETSPYSAYPDLSRPLEGSTFRFDPDDVIVDGNLNGPVNPTTFRFPRPVYLAKNKVYALMVFPDQFDGDYSIWCAKAGDQDVNTGKTISLADSGNGTLFRSKNELVWSPVIEETFTFAMRRAAFDNSATRTAVFKNANFNYTNIDTITLANTARPVLVNDFIVGIGDDTKRGKVRYLRESTGNLIFNQVTSEFVANDEIEFIRFTSMVNDSGDPTKNINLANLSQSTYDTIGNTTITSVNDLPAHAVVLQMATVQPSGTTVYSKFRGMSNNYAVDSTFLDLPLEDELEFSLLENGAQSRIVASRSNEIGQASSNSSMEINTFLYSPSSGTSPMIDMRRKDVLTVTNQINNTTALESTNDGLAASRYLSRTIELADGQDAEDLEVYITAYRPPLTDIVVYAKLLSGSDPGLFEDKAWTKLTRVTDGAITSADQFDIKEYRYQIPTSLSTDTYANGDSFSVTSSAYIAPENPSDDLEDDIVTYTDDEGVVYQRFKYFAIKIVLNTSSAEIIPHVKDLRAIALQR